MRRHVKPSVNEARVLHSVCLQENIYSLVVRMKLTHGIQSIPKSGQFYMLRAKPSSVLLARPISIYTARIVNSDGKEKASIADIAKGEIPEIFEGDEIELDFLILKKGEGTTDLCFLQGGDSLDITGPLGNNFFKPGEMLASASKSKTSVNRTAKTPSVAIVGGGIGIAPVAGFALGLEDESYDFYASFKTGTYGLDGLKSNALTITTDDGSVGVKGMLPAVLTAQTLTEKQYTLVYACGPLPMLAYVQKICLEAGVQSWLSMEEKMGCGVGACLGCNIETTEGTRRCCKAGPIFAGEKLIFGGSK
ncbi:MAG TPA: hypothetical protein PLR39_00995 [Treponemataceae bacterium]|nr:hypothetical protein [Treponemataceae bacterium]